MGMYSIFNYDNIEVTDVKGLVDFLIKIKNQDKENYNEYMYKSFLENLIDGKQYSFEDWDDIELIGYWHKNQVDFLDKISDYIEGVVQFSFESPDEMVNIVFKNGETIFELGKMEFTSVTAEELNNNKLI